MQQAVSWWQAASDQGHVDAQCDLAMEYIFGKLELNQALAWVREGADRGLADAQSLMGLMYHTGTHVETDFALAREWYLKAVNQGHPLAQCMLGEMYRGGRAW